LRELTRIIPRAASHASFYQDPPQHSGAHGFVRVACFKNHLTLLRRLVTFTLVIRNLNLNLLLNALTGAAVGF